MKSIRLTLLSLFFSGILVGQNYHFQEGFETKTPSGWLRNCASTTSLNHGSFSGSNAMKFDSDNHGESKQFETPAVNKAGTLTFYASRNANAVYFDLHICKIVNGVSTLIETVPNTSIEKKPNWTEVNVLINDASDNIKIKVWAEDKGTSTSYVALDDFSLTSDIDSRLLITKTSVVEGDVCFYNLTPNIVLTFNKEVKTGSGNITLNSEDIPMSSVTIEGRTVSIPVVLTSNKGSNKTYQLKVSEDAFIDTNDESVLDSGFVLNFETFKKPNVPDNYAEIIDIHYSEASEEMCRLDFYYPEDAVKPTPLVINMHGGAWSHGYKEEQTSFTAFTNMGFAVANVEYRMTPQATAPAAVEDVRCALQYLLNNAGSLNIDPRKIVLQGASSGAHLALVAGYLQNDRKYDSNCNAYEGTIQVLAVINKYGPSELWDLRTNSQASSVRNWLGSKQSDESFVKSVSPVHMVNASTPPTYTVHGTNDLVVPKSVSSDILVPKLSENGVPHKYTVITGGGHGGFTSTQNAQINSEIKEFVEPLLLQIDQSSSVKEINAEDDFPKIWNTNEAIYASSPGYMTIYDLYGMVVDAFRITDFTHIQLKKGTYMVKQKTIDEQQVTSKIIIN